LSKFDPLEAFDGWELEEKLEHVRRVLAMAPGGVALDSSPSVGRGESRGPSQTSSFASPAGWMLAKLAVSAITCGGILAAWWWLTDRQDLIKPALASLAIGHLAWLGKWCWEGLPAQGSPATS
jgi:hypothetical protein